MIAHAGRRRVAVTGVGVKTPAGNDVDTLWSSLCAARSAVAPVTRFADAGLPVRFAGEVTAFDPVAYLGPKETRQHDRTTHLGFAAAMDAFADAGLDRVGSADALGPGRCAVIAGTGLGGQASFFDQAVNFIDNGPSRISPRAIPMVMPNAVAALIAIRLGWTGVNMCIATACTASAHAIGEAARLIRDGSADVALAGGAESAMTPIAISAFARMGALSTRNDDPGHASRPFDAQRDGFVLGEGAAFLVLEDYELALARGARLYGEVTGYGRNSDAFHITAPSPLGAGAATCMRLAIDDAGLRASEIAHINAHGTSTPLNDHAEAAAIAMVFGDRMPPVTATKGATGHLIGAAGAVEAVASLLALRHGQVPPTANFEHPGADTDLDVVAGAARTVAPGPVLSNSFGFGGHNASLVFSPIAPADA